jgi:glycosyltransferase involved in cell wall biosynthesis
MWWSHPPVPQIGKGRRVLHVATRFLNGGSERNIAHSIMWERAAGFDVQLAVGSESMLSQLPEWLVVHRVASLKPQPQVRDVPAYRQLRQIISSGDYDVVHTHQSKAGILGRLAARGHARGIVHTVHMSSFGPGYNRLASVAYTTAERFCARLADAIVFVGTGLRDQYIQAKVVRGQRAMVIRSPIDVESFLATREWSVGRRHETRRELNLESPGPLLLAVGALEPRKRHDLMLRSLAAFLADRSGLLAIAGDGPDRAKLQSTAAALGATGQISFMGHIPNVDAAVASSDVVVHTSAAEGVPQVVIQALAAGRPVVATETTGLREIPGGRVRISPADGASLAETVAAALSEGGEPAPTAAFADWTCAVIDRGLESLHRRLTA